MQTQINENNQLKNPKPELTSRPNIMELGNEQQAERGRGAGQDQGCNGYKGQRDTLRDQVGQDHDNGTADDHAVDGDADVLRVVQGRDLDVARLPGHVHAHHEQEALVGVEDTQPGLSVLRATDLDLEMGRKRVAKNIPN